jgi:thiol-disulfide isomerase/thioredoxin
VRQFPDDPRAWGQRFSSLQMQQDAPQEQVVKAGEEWIRVYEQHPDPGAPQPYIQVAGFFANKNIRFDEIPALLEKGLKVPPPPDLMPATDLVVASARPLGMQLSNLYALSTAANAYIKIKQYDKAEAVLDKLGVALRGIKAPESGAERTPLASLESQYWDYLSKVARAQEHKIDALAFERMSITANPFPGMEEVRLRSLRDHWKELGGTDAGFDAWMKAAGSPTPAGTPPKSAQPGVANTMQPWSTMNKPMPEFVLSDADGRKWTLADLKGKVTLVNVWATWCEPCRNELPYIQKIFNKVRERKDIVVLTLNVDDNPGLIMPFLAQNHYTFPVVPAEGYVNRLIPQLSIPRNWIVDGAGAMRSERIGFGSGDDKWVDEMIASLEQARR